MMRMATVIRHVNHTTVALAFVLCILLLATQLGWTEALVASLAGGLAFDYYVLPPAGFMLEAPEDMVTLAAFILTAVTIGWLSATSNANKMEAYRRRDEMARLYAVGKALESTESAAEPIPAQLAEILGADGVAFYDRQEECILRSGPSAGRISDKSLHSVAATGNFIGDSGSAPRIVPIRHSGSISGSLGIAGADWSTSMLEAVADRVGVEMAKSLAARESMAAELARRSEDLKSAVLDALAHEIRAPLATVKVAVSTLLSRHPGEAAQQRELLEIIDGESERIERWINDATSLSRSDAGQLRLSKAPHRIGDVVSRALEGLGPLASGRVIQAYISDSIPRAIFDGEMIEKVIRQLLDNAVKYSAPGSPVDVSAEFTGTEIIVSVADRGRGIPAGDRDRIFERHYRGSGSATEVAGTGLGLASAKVILEAHGGEIWVTSSPGSGSIFSISLPAMLEGCREHAESS
jgi:two-component system sensor histidine kinase KdpD